LGLAFEGKRITACVVRRAGDRLRIRQTLQTALSLDPLTDDPELVGREVRNHLDAASIRESRCVVCVPLEWALTLRTEVPELSETDTDSFFRVQAEREFPFATEDLFISVSRYGTSDGTHHATIVAMAANHVSVLQKVLKAANLRPAGVTLGIASLLEGTDESEEGIVALLFKENGVDLGVATSGSVVALRSLDETVETDPQRGAFDVETVVRQLRITLGQMPQDLRDRVRSVKVFGPSGLVGSVFEELQSSIAPMGMSVESGESGVYGQAAESEALRQMLPTAFAAAAGRLLGRPSGLEFLPPRSSRLKVIAGRVSSRGTLWLAGAAAVVVLGFGAAFLYQYWRLSRLEVEWSAIEPRVAEIETMQQQVKQFRPWFDDLPQSLLLVRKITEAFPEEGTVWAKSVSIKKLAEVSCLGHARTIRDRETMCDSLRETDGVEELHVSEVQGDSPLQFRLTFRWNAGGSYGT